MKAVRLLPVVLLLAACGGPPVPPESPPSPTALAMLDIVGTLTVDGGEFQEQYVEGVCSVGGGYADVKYGTQVTVTDASGKVVGLGSLDGGRATDATEYQGKTMFSTCEYDFSAEAPDGLDFYGIEISNRGVVQFDRAAVQMPIKVTLG